MELDPDVGRKAGASAASSAPDAGACRSNSMFRTAVFFDVFFRWIVRRKSSPAFTVAGAVSNPVTITLGTDASAGASEVSPPDVTGSLLYTPPNGISSSPCAEPPPVPPDEEPPAGLLPEPDAASPDGLLPDPDEVVPDGLLPEPDAVPPDGLFPDEPDEEGFFASVRTNTYFSVS